ncbi:hypothetical protein WJX73_010223 [Symbiochloris irregularis]|uniref:T4 RNA ligase 1-like N-terminal domain-containing protein n=1 Tax=Symbiochloris irregularis TaxID=706552 RepID=A0AAW1NKZ3_9CHLO
MPRIDLKKFQEYLGDGRVKRQSHDALPLLIWSYTEHTQYKSLWDDITLQARGLIADTEGHIVARAFNKFFNDDERRHKPTDDWVMYEKLDGSLGILFHYREAWMIASRGSFHSPQAERALQLLSKYSTEHLDTDRSYIFEIIYPENRIVVDYGEQEALVYLATFTKDGQESFDEDLMRGSGFPVVKTLTHNDYTTFKALDTSNQEGAVVRFSNGQRMKLKFLTYLQNHKIVTGLNERSVWEMYLAHSDLSKHLEDIPDEFHGWVGDIWAKYAGEEAKITAEANLAFEGPTSYTCPD